MKAQTHKYLQMKFSQAWKRMSEVQEHWFWAP